MSEQERGVEEAQSALRQERERAIEEMLASIDRSSNWGKAAFAAVIVFKYTYITWQLLVRIGSGMPQLLQTVRKRLSLKSHQPVYRGQEKLSRVTSQTHPT